LTDLLWGRLMTAIFHFIDPMLFEK
jgi:hypothetical protein